MQVLLTSMSFLIRELLVLVCLLPRDRLSIVDVFIVDERIMYVKLVIEKQIENIVSTYTP